MRKALNFFICFMLVTCCLAWTSARDYTIASVDYDSPTDTPSNPDPEIVRLHYLKCLGCHFSLGHSPDLQEVTYGIHSDLLRCIPANGPICHYCGQHRAIFELYIRDKYRRYLPHFKNHLEYCHKYKECTCYWPDLSHKEQNIHTDPLTPDIFQEREEGQMK